MKEPYIYFEVEGMDCCDKYVNVKVRIKRSQLLNLISDFVKS